MTAIRSKAPRKGLLATALTAGVFALASLGLAPALVYSPGAQAQEAGAIEEIIVTGSRIARNPNLTNVSPVTAVNSEEFIYAGVTRTEDLLNDLPSIYAAQNAGQANGATGTATVNLRGLGTNRTLVMLNGRRLPPGTPGQGGFAPDLNQIPAALIERADVLTGGSSATYGSDAVAGVVNFITRSDFEGFQIDLQSSGYRHRNDNSSVQALLEERRTALAARNDPSAEGYETPSSSVSDGRIDTIALTFGMNAEDGRGNMTGYFTYRNVEAVLQADRDYSRCDISGFNDGCGGSGTIPNGRFTNFGGLSSGAGAIPVPADGNCPENSERRSLAPQVADGASPGMKENYCQMTTDFAYDFIPGTGDNADTFQVRPSTLLYNYNPTNFYQRPDENTTAGFFFNYDLTDNVEVYAEVNYADNHTQAQIAFSGNFFVTDDLFCGNPLMNEAQFQSLCGQLGLDKTQNISDLQTFTVSGGEDMKLCEAGEDKEFGTTDDKFCDDDLIVSSVDDDGNIEGKAAGSPASLFIGKRNVEGGPRSDDLRHTSLRGVLGLRGELPNGWDWDLYALAAEVSLEETYFNDLHSTHIGRALDVVADDDGNPVCRSVVDGSDPSCVPWNLFKGQGLVDGDDVRQGITQGALDYLVVPSFLRGTTDLRVYSGYVSGDLGQYGVSLPAADDGISMALGFEWRELALTRSPDMIFNEGLRAGGGVLLRQLQASMM